MKFDLTQLTGAKPTKGPIEVNNKKLYQENVEIATLSQEALNYLIAHRKELALLRFSDIVINKKGKCVSLKLNVKLQSDIAPTGETFNWFKVAYYVLIMITSLIFLIFSLIYQERLMLNILLILVFASSTYLLVDYLNSKGKLERWLKK